MLDDKTYTPNRFLNFLHEKFGTENELQLSKKIGISHSVIYRIASRETKISVKLMSRVIELFPDLTMMQLRKMAGLPKD
jgi:hypothetical protein